MDNPYLEEIAAAVYDARNTALDDLPLYLDFAARQGGGVLELACGTGRLLLPLARAGHELTGVDSSPRMLQRLRARLENEREDVRRRVQIEQQDMREFSLNRRFGLAFIAANSFIGLVSPDDQERFLRSVSSHLVPNGLLIIDLFVPDPVSLSRPPKHVTSHPAFDWPEEDARVLFSEMLLKTDRIAQTQDLEWTYEVVTSSGSTRKYIVPFRIRYTYPQELTYLLERCGLTVAARFGGWQREELAEGASRMIVVARRPD